VPELLDGAAEHDAPALEQMTAARHLGGEAQVLIETSEGLSPMMVAELIAVLRRLQAQGVTMVIAAIASIFCSPPLSPLPLRSRNSASSGKRSSMAAMLAGVRPRGVSLRASSRFSPTERWGKILRSSGA
jgi:hypothetical protein